MSERGEVGRHISEALRQAVATRAGGRCEHCHLPQTARLFRFPLDHIVSIKHGDATSSDNLALACLTCNAYKGSDIATLVPETGALTPLYHPRRQHWNSHFVLDRSTGEIRGRTPAGRATAALLQMNTWERIEERVRLIGLDRVS